PRAAPGPGRGPVHGAGDLVAVVLAAGAGRRLRPLTEVRPKALCPVNNVALVDIALERAGTVAADVAVNIHHGRAAMEQHLDGRAHLSVEEPEALGTAGALGQLRSWIAGRPVLVLNCDAWHPHPLSALVDGWDGKQVRLLTVHEADRGDFGPLRYAGAALMPWSAVAGLEPEPSGLYEVSWRSLNAAGELDLVTAPAPFFDCGTPGEYLAANLAASGGSSVIGPGAIVLGEVVRSVVWPGGTVRKGERLVDSIRVGADLTVTPGAV
ncbi:MAG TPA: sugar phosphate nucleotidyltransferase, partial [Acidimicrobiales bacterium]|nr:sugar phosphate nucleotidyltransferase [Acidimicrobiales bacterium]